MLDTTVPNVRTNGEKFDETMQIVLGKVGIQYASTPGYTTRTSHPKSLGLVFGEYYKIKGDVDEFGHAFDDVLSHKWPEHCFKFTCIDDENNKAETSGVFTLNFTGKKIRSND